MGNRREYIVVNSEGEMMHSSEALCVHLTQDEFLELYALPEEQRYEVAQFCRPAPSVWECMWDLVYKDGYIYDLEDSTWEPMSSLVRTLKRTWRTRKARSATLISSIRRPKSRKRTSTGLP